MTGSNSAVVRWLKFDFAQFAKDETFEYSVKKPLFAASIVLRTRKDLTKQNLIALAQVTAKIPFAGHKEIEASSETAFDDASENLAGFDAYREKQVSREARQWLSRLDVVEVAKESQAPKQYENKSERLSLLNPLLMVKALAGLSLPLGTEAAAHFVVSSKVFGLKLTATADSTLIVYAKEVPGPLSDEQWLNTDWAAAYQIEVRRDLEAGTVTNFKVRVPVFGVLELPLTRHSVEP